LKACLDARFGAIDRRFASIDEGHASTDQRFDAIDRRFGQVDQRFGAIDHRFADLREGVRSGDADTRRLVQAVEGRLRAAIRGRSEEIDPARRPIGDLRQGVARLGQRLPPDGSPA
jgi:hypothetical protein